MIEFEIDGKVIAAEEGSTIIEAADREGIYIPRFCYHRKLSVAANCRMCLVEVEKAPKPLPACATPITPGMKVMTCSTKTKEAQQAVMEYLLINHPLDCPICDQGGECELQDLSMGYGIDHSNFSECKRSVHSEDIGPLVETEMTRCIHCTRCVRFGEEVAGLREIGAVNRGEHMEITTYVKHFLHSEMSGNIIDLCPVGALTNKPAQYAGRGWEYREHPTVAPHDCVGSNIYVHTRSHQDRPQKTVMRVVPRENEAINEIWISDRDRYSCHALYHETRLLQPEIKRNGEWVKVTWEEALKAILSRVQQTNGTDVAGLIYPTATLEECYLFQKLIRGLGSSHVDHRVRMQDFKGQENWPCPTLGISFAEIAECDALLLVGSRLRLEQPMLSHMIMKGLESHDSVIMSIQTMDDLSTFPLKYKKLVGPQYVVQTLAEVVKAIFDLKGVNEPSLKDITPSVDCRSMAEELVKAKRAVVWLGESMFSHAQWSEIQALSARLCEVIDGKLGYLTPGSNSVGAWLAGALPHCEAGGVAAAQSGKTAYALLNQHPAKGYFLFQFEPELDTAAPGRALEVLHEAEWVVSMTTFVSDSMRRYSDVLLPIAPFSETDGTFVNAEGTWQTFKAASVSEGDSKPGWKVLRVLGGLLDIKSFEELTPCAIREAIKEAQVQHKQMNSVRLEPFSQQTQQELMRHAPWPIYRCDALVRRSLPLQETPLSEEAVIAVNQKTAVKYHLVNGGLAKATQGTQTVLLPIKIDERVADDTVYLPSGLTEVSAFGCVESPIRLEQSDEGEKP